MTNLVGQTLGQYQLIELIHDGANTVYKGFQPGMNRYVAVKVLDSRQAGNPAFVQQFQQDMQFIASLEHPNLLPILDHGQQNEWLYLVTRFIESGTLQGRLSQGYQYNLQQAQQLTRPIAEALDYLHGRGAVHGNLKPTNILIDPQGQPLLTDFGFTQGIDVGQQENAYLSPEQARGEPIDRRTDVYALGALLYELVIGQPPPVGGGPGPRSIRPDLPVAVEQVILKAMAQNPDQRFQSAGELSNALSAALAPQAAPVAQPVQPAPAPAPAPQPAQAAQPESKGGTNWVMILIGVAVVCLLAMICSGLFAYFGVTSQDSSESPLLVPIFIGGPTDTPGPTEPEVPPAPEEPPAPEPPPEEPPPEEPPVQEPPAEEPPAEEPPAEENQ